MPHGQGGKVYIFYGDREEGVYDAEGKKKRKKKRGIICEKKRGKGLLYSSFDTPSRDPRRVRSEEEKAVER